MPFLRSRCAFLRGSTFGATLAILGVIEEGYLLRGLDMGPKHSMTLGESGESEGEFLPMNKPSLYSLLEMAPAAGGKLNSPLRCMGTAASLSFFKVVAFF